MPARVAVLGGGVGGTLVANLLDKALGRDARVSVIDPTGMHHYQPGYLYVALGQANGKWLARDERTLLRPRVDLIVDRAIRIHPDAGTVQLERGSVEWDYLVIATGARLMHIGSRGSSKGHSASIRWTTRSASARSFGAFRGGPSSSGSAASPTSAHRRRSSSCSWPRSTCASAGSATEPRDAALPAQSGLHDRVGERSDPADPRGTRDRAVDVLQRRAGGSLGPHAVVHRGRKGRVRPPGARSAA